MKIAVLSDIHGNYHAFKACLEVAFQRNIDMFIFLGDYLGEFAYPQRTLKTLYELKEKYECCFIRGNKEDYSLNMSQGINCEWRNGNSEIYGMIYNYESLSPNDLEFFSKMNICDTIELDGAPSITFCHGSLKKNSEGLMKLTEGVKEQLRNCESKYILCGHSHVQQIMDFEGKTLINPGAVGVALHSQGGESRFTILELNNGEWNHEFIHVDYNKDDVVKELHESGLYEKSPCWCSVTEHLIRTGETSHGSVLDEAIRLCKEENAYTEWYNIPKRYWEKALVNMGIN